jgi:uncharacterized Zn-binding protein involved in type VI secretion
MPRPTARLTDLWSGICCCHFDPPCIGMSGPIITCSPNVRTNNLGNARIGDVVIGFCGHAGIIVTCSPNVITNNRGQARLGDAVSGCTIGNIVTGSPNSVLN